MALIGLIACSATKAEDPNDTGLPAAELYTGPLFRKARAYVEANCDSYLILSALWNTLLPSDVIRPYDFSFKSRSFDQAGRRRWADKTFAQLEDRLDPEDTILCLASAPYREWAPRSPWAITTPLIGLGIGQQLGWLKTHNELQAAA